MNPPEIFNEIAEIEPPPPELSPEEQGLVDKEKKLLDESCDGKIYNKRKLPDGKASLS
ncbi:MAG: hypothetical protein RDV48_19270 [Candidatus Eremiobacteraeota bacterium]|nr:hypothetical protein [Candidatus Eremiobacteraeota bacterium]